MQQLYTLVWNEMNNNNNNPPLLSNKNHISNLSWFSLGKIAIQIQFKVPEFFIINHHNFMHIAMDVFDGGLDEI